MHKLSAQPQWIRRKIHVLQEANRKLREENERLWALNREPLKKTNSHIKYER